jgi:hypothetical protein
MDWIALRIFFGLRLPPVDAGFRTNCPVIALRPSFSIRGVGPDLALTLPQRLGSDLEVFAMEKGCTCTEDVQPRIWVQNVELQPSKRKTPP